MRKILLGILVLISVFTLAGCDKETSDEIIVNDENTSANESQMIVYENKSKGFSLSYDSNWNFKEDVYGSVVMFFAPQKAKDDVTENFGVVVQATDVAPELNLWYEETKTILGQTFSDFSVEDEMDITVSGIAAKKIIYSAQQGDYKLKFQQILLIKDNKLYVFTYTALKKTFNDYLKLIDTMVASIVL